MGMVEAMDALVILFKNVPFWKENMRLQFRIHGKNLHYELLVTLGTETALFTDLMPYPCPRFRSKNGSIQRSTFLEVRFERRQLPSARCWHARVGRGLEQTSKF